MKTFSIYRKSDGSFTGTVYTVPEADIGINTPEGHGAIEGEHDHLSRRVDLSSLKDGQKATHEHVCDYQPPSPSDDHEWNVVTRRWQLSKQAQQKADADAAARAELARIDFSAIRALIDNALGDPSAKERLAAIAAQKDESRSKVVQRD